MRYFLFLILTQFVFQAKSQDKIYNRRNDIILAQIQEVGTDDVKYKLFSDLDGPTYKIEKYNVLKIIYHNGQTEKFKSSLKNPELYKGQPKNAFKVNFLSPINGYLQLGYERSLKPNRSMEFNVGLIGIGINRSFTYRYAQLGVNYAQDYQRDAKGANIGIGFKFIKTPAVISKKFRFTHLLQGSYVKPTLYLGKYDENIVYYKIETPRDERRTVNYGSLMVEMGYQWVFNQRFLLDVNLGLGYCIDNIKDNETYNYWGVSSESQANHFNTLRVGNSPGFALNAGIKFGILF